MRLLSFRTDCAERILCAPSPTETRRSKSRHVVCLVLSEWVEQYLWFVTWNEAVCESLDMDLSMEQRLATKCEGNSPNGKCSLWGPSIIPFECLLMVWAISCWTRKHWRRPQEWPAYRASQWQECRDDFSVVASETSPFSKSASRRGEHWQGHSEKDCNWRFAKNGRFVRALFHTLWHNATIVKQFLVQRKVTVLDHPPYSPDFAPAVYFLFPKVKSHLKGHLFDSFSDIQLAVTSTLNTTAKDDFYKGIQKLYDRANLCVQLQGTCVEN